MYKRQPSHSGKGVLLSNFILDIYKDCFERVYIFSPSINVDHTWIPVKEYLDKTINLSESEPPLYYDHYDPENLEKIIDTQKKVTEHLKPKKDNKKLYSILIIVDDFADDPSFSRKSQLLHALFTRGRHSQISTIVSTQKLSALHPIIRVNTKILHVFRLRNYQDLQMFLDEVSALIDKIVDHITTQIAVEARNQWKKYVATQLALGGGKLYKFVSRQDTEFLNSYFGSKS